MGYFLGLRVWNLELLSWEARSLMCYLSAMDCTWAYGVCWSHHYLHFYSLLHQLRTTLDFQLLEARTM